MIQEIQSWKDWPEMANPIEGDMVYVADETKAYIYRNGEWEKYNLPEGSLNMNLYDLNKSAVASLPDLTEEELEAKKEVINTLISKSDNKYYMLLNNEFHYYTLFAITDIDVNYKFADEVILCLKDFADSVKVIDIFEDYEDQTAIEIWVMINGEAYIMYLFPYD